MAKQISVVVDVQGKIDSFKSAVSEMQGYLNKLSLPALQEGKATSLFGQITREIENIQRLTAKGSVTPIDQKAIEKSEQAIANLLGELNLFAKSPAITGAWSKDLVSAWDKATKAIKEYGTAWADIQKRQGQLEAGKAKAQKTIDTKDFRQKELLGTARARETQYTSNINKYNDAQKAAYQKAFDEYRKIQSSGRVGYQKVDTWLKSLKPEELQALDLSKKFNLDETQAKLKSIQQIISDIEKGNQISTEAATPHKMVGETKDYNASVREAEEAAKTIEDADKAIQNISTETASRVQDLKNALSGLSSAGVDIQKFLPDGKDLNTATYEELVLAFDKLQEELKETADNTPAVEKGMNGIKGAAENLNGVFDETGKSLEELSERQKQAQQTLSRLQYAFSAVSVFQLFKRAIRSAHQAVKELDAAMMETAVVTKYTISDLWAKLPEYTERANRLGVSTLGAYQSATLYYQQGLNDKQVGAISEETLKMARIASLDYADATNYMTAALRGFNMELNEVSAERVNDVYNRLAAMTAADTAGIATAMTKTASIAKSAGIEFEQMAAFLAQIIETTQESPETAGTAMKTVIARFSEVKKLYSEGQILGSDEEGEEINVNKIQEALRKVGISMTGFFTGKEGLGDILIELASKWNTLDVATQRYIATTAAGSRQQSRFIALMQDYSRTQELVGAAYDSEGASQTQFEKTLDSLDAKTQQLKNAWNEFLLDLANSDVIKGVVDLLNGIVTALNKITGALGSGSGLAKLMLGLGVLGGGRALLGGAKNMIDPTVLKQYGNSRLMAFRAGAAAQMGLKGTGEKGVYDPMKDKSVVGSAFRQKFIDPQKAFLSTFKKGSKAEGKGLWSLSKAEAEQAKIAGGQAAAAKIEGYKATLKKEQDELVRLKEVSPITGTTRGSDQEIQQQQVRVDNAQVEVNKANTAIAEGQQAAQESGAAVQQYGQSLQAAGQIAGIAAGLFFFFANAAEEAGNPELAKTFKIIAVTLTVLSGVLSVLGTVAMMTGAKIAAGAEVASTAIKAIPFIGWAAAIISALIAIGATIAAFIETPAEKAKRLQEELEKTQEEVEALKDKLSAIKDAAKDIFEQQNLFDNLIVGTEAWNTSLENLKQSIFELIATYPELADAVEFVDGKWQLNMDKYAKYIQDQNEKLHQAQLLEAGKGLISAKATAISNIKTLGGGDAFKGAEIGDYRVINEVLFGSKEAALGIIQELFGGRNADKKDLDAIYNGILAVIQNQVNFDDREATETVFKSLGIETTLNQKYFAAETNGESDSLYDIIHSILSTNGMGGGYLATFSDSAEKIQPVYNKYLDIEKQYLSSLLVSGFEDTKVSKDSKVSSAFSKSYSNLLAGLFSKIPSLDEIIEENSKYDLSKEEIQKRTGTEEEVSDEARESYIQSLYLIDKANETIDNQYKLYQGLSTDQQRGYYLASITGENDYLPVVQMSPEELKEIAKSFPEKFTEWLDLDNLVDPFQDFYDQLYSGLEDSSKEILQGIASNAGQFSQLKQAYKTGNVELVDDIFSQISEGIKSLPEEAQQKARDILGAIDWSSVSDIRSGFNQFAEIEGLDIDFNNLADSAVEATGALLNLAQVDFQKKLEQHQESRKAAEKFAKGERTYTEEERKALIKGGIKSSNFIMDSTGNYTYMGNFTEGLKQIEEYNWKDWFGTIQDAQEAIREGGKFLEKGETQPLHTYQKKNGAYTVNYGVAFSDTEGNSYTATKLSEIYDYIASGVFTETQYKILAESFERLGITSWEQLESQAKLATSIDENTAILAQLKTLSQGEAAGYSAQTLLSNKTTLEEEGNISVDAALDQKLLQGDLEATAEAYAKVNDYLEENGTLTKGVTLKVAEATERYDDLAKTIDDNSDALEKYDKESIKYRQAILSITKAAKRAFGDNITSDFVEENLDLFKEWASGSKEAAAQLQENLKNSIPGPELAEQDTKRFYSAIESELLNPLNFDVYGNFNKAGIDNGIQSTEEDMKKLQEYLASIGFTLTWEDLGAVPGDASGTLRNFKASINNTAGTYSGFKPKSGGGGGKTSPWENPYDKYHNLLQEIDELLRTRNDLERQYEKILANRHSTIQDILKNSRENLANLEREIVAQKMLQKGRQEQFRNLAKDDYYFDEKGKRRSFAQQAAEFGINLSDYARYNEETQEMEINWDAFEEVERRSETDAKWAEVGKFLQKYYDKLKELTDSYEDTQDTIEEMEDAIQEILERSKEDYLDFEQELYDALVDHVQQYIDAEQKLSDTIKDAESKVLDHLRESIDLERQIRDNTKTEEDIADKENRLAYLQRDTTGANAVEIMQLQKEIQEARENYQDTLVDQELERLNRISEEAAQQREHQIELMQEQLDWAQKAGYFWNEVESILQTALKSGDTSLIEQLLKGVSDFNEKSMFGDRAWKDELIERFLKASEGRANWELDNAKENHTSWASRIAATGKEGTVGIWWDTEKKQWVDAKGNTYTGVGYDVQTGKWKYEDRSDRVKEPPSSGGSGTQSQPQEGQKPQNKTYSSTQKYKGYEGTATSKNSQKEADNLAMKDAIKKAIDDWTAQTTFARDRVRELSANMQMLPKNASKVGLQRELDYYNTLIDELRGNIIAARAELTKYKTGGLATQTGPAWLDGTPSKPEYVLNAAQTQAFLQLADVLPSMVSGGSSLTNAPTAVNIDIDINVDSIANDYDVDRLCDRVKEDLYSDLMYRNINVVNLRR